MNIQVIYSRLDSRAKTSSVFCGIYAGVLWAVSLLAAVCLRLAGRLGGTYFGKLGGIDHHGVVAGYEAIGSLFMSAFMGFAMLAMLVCVLLLIIPAVLFTVASAGGFSKAKKEQTAIRTPGAVVDFRLFRKDAVFKLAVSGVTLAFALWTEVKSLLGFVNLALENRSPGFLHERIHGVLTELGVSLLVLSPVAVVFVLALMNLTDISRWRKWLGSVRAQNMQP